MAMISGAGPAPFGRWNGQRRCSFCGRREAAVTHLVRSRGVHICDSCIAEAQEAVASAPSGKKLLRIKPKPARVGDREAAEQAVERAFETAFSSEIPDAERSRGDRGRLQSHLDTAGGQGPLWPGTRCRRVGRVRPVRERRRG